MSSYVVLARRYRPQRFQDLVGQEHVSVTLRNAVLQKRFAHAYLFTGPRGVGKTSAARILAKALRCSNLTAEGEPCNTCDACESVNNQNSLDVIEIDAASNTGVDNIRDLRQNVEFMAAVGKYRVYIIDEVHMLSTAAFNALLKTLEEPPPHVIFIFATTELHKILPTIQSRCQRFDFKRIAPGVMTTKLQEICNLEGVAIDDFSLRTLVMESEGCLRDAESLLDQAIALCGKNIKIEELSRALSLIDRGSFFKLVEAIGEHDTATSLKLCAAQFENGLEPKTLLGRLTEFFSDLHFFAFTGTVRNPDPDQDALMAKLKSQLAPDEIIRALDLCLKQQSQITHSVSANYSLESLVIRLCIQRPALTVVQQQNVTPQTSQPMQYTQSQSQVQSAPSLAPRSQPTNPAQPQAAASPSVSKNDLSPLESFIRAQKPAWFPVLQSVLSVEVDETSVNLVVRNDFAGKRLASNDGIEVLKKAYGKTRAVVSAEQPSSGIGADGKPEAPPQDPREKIAQKHKLAKEHEAVKAALSIFENSSIIEAKVLDDASSGNRSDRMLEKSRGSADKSTD